MDLKYLSGREDERRNPGEIIFDGKHYIYVACGEGALCIETVQEPGKKPVDASAYLNGKRLKIGDLLC